MYKQNEYAYNKVYNLKKIPITNSAGSGFRFISISGSGVPTPLHSVYETPVDMNTEILY
jgi:hypothetical protein